MLQKVPISEGNTCVHNYLKFNSQCENNVHALGSNGVHSVESCTAIPMLYLMISFFKGHVSALALAGH